MNPLVHLALFRTSDADAAALAARCLPRLHPEERARQATLRSPKRRLEWLAGRTLLLALLEQARGEIQAELLRSRTDGGVGYRGAADLQLSLSHTDGLVAAALASRAVGVDVERPRPRELVEAAPQLFTPMETAALAAVAGSPRLELFYDFWTLKEAACKAAGVPLWQGLRQFGFDLGARPRFSTPLAGAAPPWCFWLGAWAGEWRLALALRAGAAELQAWTWQPDQGLQPATLPALRSFGA